MDIKINLTNTNYNVMSDRKIEYIVIHYVGAVSTAYANTKYFKNEMRYASAHYFVDDNEVWQCVEDKNKAWHCGDKGVGTFSYRCSNSNSIGIEMCCFMNNGILDMSDKTINKTIELTKYLMTKYNIPASNVIRHYDVTTKCCPAPFVNNVARWNDFKVKLGANNTNTTNNTTGVVSSLQRALNSLGEHLEVDNSKGNLTNSALKRHYCKYKDKNDLVKWVQTRLIDKGYSCGSCGADGSFGNATLNAVKKYQRDRKLVIDGYAGYNTITSLCK